MSWRVLPEAERPRQYHSVALLMPDGAVWVAGSNFNSGTGLANRELHIEIFEPWYFCGRRPVITEAVETACHGEEFEIRTPDADSIQQVVLVRCGSVTHNFNPDQRHISLEFGHENRDILIATVPNNAAVAIVGYYLHFVIDGTGRPSLGKFIQICRSTKTGWDIADEDFWRWLRDLLSQGARLEGADLRRLRRALVQPSSPPRRRLAPPMPPHGEHDHNHDHDHDHDHNHHQKPEKRRDKRPKSRR